MTSLNPFAPLVDRVRTWPVASQLGARRNAMIASTAMAARRAEREDADAFLAGLKRRDTVVRVAVSSRH